MLLLKKENELRGRSFRAQIAPKTCFPEHMHDHFELELILEGEGIFTINGEEYRLAPNTLTIMTPAHIHSIRSEGITLFNVEFDSTSVSLPVWDLREPFFLRLEQKDADFIRILLEEIRQSQWDRPAYASRLLACVLEKAVLCKNDAEPGGERYANEIFLYVMEHFRTNLTLKTVADKFGLSPSYVSDLFSRKFGVKFKEYVDSLRFPYACSQLTFSDFPVKEVCANAGFSDYANFSRRFREKYGKTPREYRMETKKETLD